jgi:hypothetical protein
VRAASAPEGFACLRKQALRCLTTIGVPSRRRGTGCRSRRLAAGATRQRMHRTGESRVSLSGTSCHAVRRRTAGRAGTYCVIQTITCQSAVDARGVDDACVLLVHCPGGTQKPHLALGAGGACDVPFRRGGRYSREYVLHARSLRCRSTSIAGADSSTCRSLSRTPLHEFARTARRRAGICQRAVHGRSGRWIWWSWMRCLRVEVGDAGNDESRRRWSTRRGGLRVETSATHGGAGGTTREHRDATPRRTV